MHPVLDDLITLLRLERIENNIFRGDSRDIGLIAGAVATRRASCLALLLWHPPFSRSGVSLGIRVSGACFILGAVYLKLVFLEAKSRGSVGFASGVRGIIIRPDFIGGVETRCFLALSPLSARLSGALFHRPARLVSSVRNCWPRVWLYFTGISSPNKTIRARQSRILLPFMIHQPSGQVMNQFEISTFKRFFSSQLVGPDSRHELSDLPEETQGLVHLLSGDQQLRYRIPQFGQALGNDVDNRPFASSLPLVDETRQRGHRA